MNEEKACVIRYIDLYGGAGGFRLGLERANDSRPQSGSTECGSPLTQGGQERGRPRPSEEGGRADVRGQGAAHDGGGVGADPIPGTGDAEGRSEPFAEGRGGRLVKEFRCVWYADIDKYANAVYNHQFKESHVPTDVRGVDAGSIPDFDLLCAGFPCQSFSIAGKRGGFEDARGTLFFEIARIAQVKRPRLLLLENVKGLLNHDAGRTFRTILGTLDELGYDAEWEVLNSKHFGVPQNRERVFIVGHSREHAWREVFPLGEGQEGDDGAPREEQGGGERVRRQLSGSIDGNFFKGWGGGRTILNVSGSPTQSKRVYGTDGLSPALSIHGPTGGADGLKILRWQNKKDGVVADSESPALRASGGTDIRKRPSVIMTPHGKEEGGVRDGETSPTIDDAGSRFVVADMPRIRRLTPMECNRLQSFPDDWDKFGIEFITPETYYRDYADAEKTDPSKILRELREAITAGSGEGREFTELASLLEKEVLQQRVHEDGLPRKMEGKPTPASRPIQSETVGRCDRMWEMWLDGASGHPSQGQKHIGQLFVKLRGALQELSHAAPPERFGRVVVISDSQRYKLMGNAVTTSVVSAIGRRILETWSE